MARDVDYKNPDSWDDDDKLWLRDRIERVPVEHRHLLVDGPTFPPAATAESPEMERLRLFLEREYPDEMAAEGQTPVGLVIELLGADDSSDDPGDPGYENWKSAELMAEIQKRRDNGRDIPGDKFTRPTAAAALRADDANA
jgi:hypothetical protein